LLTRHPHSSLKPAVGFYTPAGVIYDVAIGRSRRRPPFVLFGMGSAALLLELRVIARAAAAMGIECRVFF